jgi:hypothetical protein
VSVRGAKGTRPQERGPSLGSGPALPAAVSPSKASGCHSPRKEGVFGSLRSYPTLKSLSSLPLWKAELGRLGGSQTILFPDERMEIHKRGFSDSRNQEALFQECL